MRSTRFALAILLLAAGSLWAADGISAKLDEYMTALEKMQRFSGAVLVAKDGQALLSKGYGRANYEWDIPNSPQTKFRLGSITKQFTATAVLQLEERGLLSVNDPISKHLPDYPKAAGDKITIHHLLTHSSGIPSYTNSPDYRKNMRVAFSAEQMVDGFKDKPLEYTPGEKFRYNNSGYFLLGVLIEKVSGKKYDAYLQENIFGPLGMKDSGYDRPQPLLRFRASGYDWSADGPRNTEYLDMGQPYAAGSLYSTVEDLFKWDQALYTEKVLKKASFDKMFKPQIEAGGAMGHYGYGWGISKIHNRAMIGHGGGINGFATFIARFPEERAVVIFLRNVLRPGGPNLQNDLAAILFGEKYELPKEKVAVKIDTRIYDAYVGKYEIRPNFIATVTREGDRLFLHPSGQARGEIKPLSETRFFTDLVDAEVTFVKNAKGEVESLIIHQGGRDTPAKRMP
jgi:CubicO group peptidase (beta-lactamase class C family)